MNNEVMTHCCRTPLLLAMLLTYTGVTGQAWNTPKIWENVRYDRTGNLYEDGSSTYRAEYWEFQHKNSERSTLKWLVFTNKAGVKVLSEPNGNEIATLPFSQRLWVFAENKEYLKVGDQAEKPTGWVRKQDLILWTNPLRDKDTGIEIKAFAVNTTRASRSIAEKSEVKDRFDLYDAPQGGKKLGVRPLYEVMFVFQYAPGVGNTEGRYLVSENFTLNSASGLAGWVSADRLKLWATNLCLEPNWDPEAIQERRDKQMYAHIFESGRQENNQRRDAYFSSGGKNAIGALFHDPRDPAFEEPNAEWKPRLKGFLFRNPVFGGVMMGSENCAFFTGAPVKLSAEYATITEGAASQDNYRMIQGELEEMDRKRHNLNVVFVVEAGQGPRISWVTAAMNALVKGDDQNRLSIGAVVYNNDNAAKPNASESTYVVKKPLEPRGKGLEEWFKARSMEPLGDLLPTRPAYTALIRAIEMTRPGETNVIIHLLGAPDHSEDDTNSERPGYADDRDLKAALAKNRNVHYLGYVLPSASDPQLAERTFAQMKETTLLTLAVGMREKYRSLLELHRNDGKMPAAPKPEEQVENGQRVVRALPAATELKARMYQPGSELGPLVLQDVEKCVAAADGFFKIMEKIVKDNSDVAGQASSASTEASSSLIEQLCAEVSKGSDSAKERCIQYSFANKVHYFMDASSLYHPSGLNAPLFKYVVFMPQAKLAERIEKLDVLISVFEQNPLSEKRRTLAKHWEDTSKDILGRVDPKVGLKEILERMMGISQLNIVMPFKVDEVFAGLKVKDLESPSAFSDEGVRKMVNHYSNQLKELRAVQGNKDLKYEIGDGDGDVFYWVPAEFLLN